MQLSDFVPLLLFLHVMGAIIAFGPTYVFPIIGGMGGKEPMHANFALRVSLAITDQRVEPLAMLQGVTGLFLIFAAKIDFSDARWLEIGIVLYVIALGYALSVQRRLVKKAVALTSTPPPGAEGPPPELVATIRRIGQGGMFLAIMVFVIVILMVMKPTF